MGLGLGKWSALSESLPRGIFISYRHQETAWPARQLYNVLVEHFRPEQVFKDVDNIEPGQDFVEQITKAVGSCEVLLALIGPQWLTITDEKTRQRRLDNPKDYVRLEIETALTRKIRVIPILVDDARMPDFDELPATLADLVYLQAVQINPLTFDTNRLISTVGKILAEPNVPPEVGQLYGQALAAFSAEQWDEAVDLLGQVLSRQPDYADAARKLESARRQQELARRYAQASAAADAGDWQEAVAGYTMIAEADPDYRDTNARLPHARYRQQLANLDAEAHRLHRAGQWAAVIKVGEQLQAIDPSGADPDGLIASARAELAKQQTPGPAPPPIVPPRKHWRTLIVVGLAIAAVLITMVVVVIDNIRGGEPSDFTKQGDIEVWQGKDTSGDFQKLVDQFNSQHPNGEVTFHELPAGADQQRQQMIQNAQIKNPKMAVMSVGLVLTAEFAAKGYIEALPPDKFPTTDFLPVAVDAATYLGKLYAYPSTSDGGLLYYRKDLLDKYGLKPPTTFDEMKAACDTIQAGEKDPKLGCFAGQYRNYDGLTVTLDEAVRGAGGVIVGDDGKPNVATPEAIEGLSTLVDWFNDGHIPKAAITWGAERSRQAFQKGQLIFHRNWSWAYSLTQNDGSSAIVGKFDVAPLPGITGPGVSSLGGQNYVIAKYAQNKGTAVDFLKFMSSPEAQKSRNLATNAPVLASLYSDPDIVKKFPYMPTLLKSIQTAKPRPKAVNYGDVTAAIQDAAYPALQGLVRPDAALQELQAKLRTLIK
jgi:multiple sugar transport system substrate-binding protein